MHTKESLKFDRGENVHGDFRTLHIKSGGGGGVGGGFGITIAVFNTQAHKRRKRNEMLESAHQHMAN